MKNNETDVVNNASFNRSSQHRLNASKRHIRVCAVTIKFTTVASTSHQEYCCFDVTNQSLQCRVKSRRFVYGSRCFQQGFRSEVETVVEKCVDLFLGGIGTQFGLSFVWIWFDFTSFCFLCFALRSPTSGVLLHTSSQLQSKAKYCSLIIGLLIWIPVENTKCFGNKLLPFPTPSLPKTVIETRQYFTHVTQLDV